MSKRNMTVTVTDKAGSKTTFDLCVHQTERDADRHLELSWYKENGGALPVGTHHEVEVISLQPDCDRRAKHLNFHQSVKDGTDFMCYPNSLPTREETDFLITLWAMGTVHAILTGKSLISVLRDYSFNNEKAKAWYEGEGGYSVALQAQA